MAARHRSIIPKSVKDGGKVLELLREAWKKAGMRQRNFSDFEAALVRAGIELRRVRRRKKCL
jgi:hypothetical protein